MLRIVSYADAITESADHRRHLLLGNGFSIAARANFRYGSLFEEAFPDNAERLRHVFELIGTTDFEHVLSSLDSALTVLACYPDGHAIIGQIREDRAAIARRLIEAITRIHPGNSRDVDDAQYAAVGRFLGDIRRPDTPALAGRIFTTNYDLLLYWATMRNFADVRTGDGFGPSPAGLVWTEGEQQSVFHLHGALHMFVATDGSITKLVWNTPLIEQIASRINRDMLPLFVTEGSSEQKLQRIAESPYLRHALSCFGTDCCDPEAVLFVFGSALNDVHIVDRIIEGNLRTVFISVTDIGRTRPALAALEAQWIERRRALDLPDIELVLFPAADAAPWG